MIILDKKLIYDDSEMCECKIHSRSRIAQPLRFT